MILDAYIIPVTSFHQNCTLLFNKVDKKGVIIDPGGNIDLIKEAIIKHNINVEKIWLTHGHIDHAASAMDLKDLLNVEIFGPHISDKPLLDRLSYFAKEYLFLEKSRNCFPDKWLNEQDTVYCSKYAFQVLHCPGHTPGHIIYFSRENSLAIVGDVIFRNSIGRTDFAFSNKKHLMASINEKIIPLGDEVKFICGHGPSSSIGRERKYNPYLRG